MTTEEILIVAGIAVAVLVVLGLILWVVSARQRKRRERLRERYGREYEATVDAKGRRAGVDDLDHREEERETLRLRDPGEATRADLRQRMAEAQFRFVEEPHEVLLETQRVVVDGLRARGYPIAEDRDQALRLLSVDHPDETPGLRALLEGNYGRDVGRMRELFVEARRTLADVLGVSYTQRDVAAGAPAEAGRAPEGTSPQPAGGRPQPGRSATARDVPPPRAPATARDVPPPAPDEPGPRGRERAARAGEGAPDAAPHEHDRGGAGSVPPPRGAPEPRR